MTNAVAVYQGETSLAMTMTPQEARAQLRELQEFVKEAMIEGEDYGIIPGTQKPTLFKPGAEKLAEIYGLAPIVTVENRIEDWDKGFFHYEVACALVSKRSGNTVATGIGSCNSKEERYRWRDQKRACPQCGKPAIIKGRAEYGGGWLCFARTGGCGAKFQDGDQSIEGQPQGRIENPDPYTLVNTILKIAKKRAMVDATLSATRSSALFTQDMEDGIIDGHAEDDTPRPASPPPAPARSPQAARQTAQPSSLGECPKHHVQWLASRNAGGSPYHRIEGGYCNKNAVDKELRESGLNPEPVLDGQATLLPA